MDGSVGFPLRLELPPGARGSVPTLRPGDKLTIKILSRLGGGRYLVLIRGVRVQARSQVQLPVGGRFRAEVGPRGGISLKPPQTLPAAKGPVPSNEGTIPLESAPRIPPAALLADQPAIGPIRAHELDPLSQRVVEALLRSGIPPTPQMIATVRTMIPAEREHDAQFLRFVSLLADKHLLVGRSGAEGLYHSLEGVNPDAPQNEEGGPYGGAGNNQDSSGLNDRKAGRDRLREQLQARGSGELSPLALFNHVQGEHATWIALPYRLDQGRITLSGSIRMLVTAESGSLSVLKAVIVVDGEKGERSAYLVDGSPPRRLRVLCSNHAMRRRLERSLPLLAEKLRNLGIEIDDTISGDIGFDGFTTDRQEIKGIDTIV